MSENKNLTWRSLNDSLSQKTEKQVLKMLEDELAGERRATVIQRLHQRYTMLRCARERVVLMKKARKPWSQTLLHGAVKI